MEVVYGHRCVGKGLERFPRPLLGRALEVFPGDEVTYTIADAAVAPAIQDSGDFPFLLLVDKDSGWWLGKLPGEWVGGRGLQERDMEDVVDH